MLFSAVVRAQYHLRIDSIPMVNVSETWGTKPQERELVFPCDRLISKPEAAAYRGISIHASPPVVFRWLCQMRVAPYSYDWIDNAGRQSPRELTPGMENLAIGQEVMRIFTLVDFERDRHITIRIKAPTTASRTFGDIAVSYLLVSQTPNSCRLVVKLIAKYPRNARGHLWQAFLPWGDLIMMRRQLMNFKQLAENS